MKKILLSTISIMMLSTAASAADLDMAPAPAPEPIAVYDWNGFYVGAAAGWLGGTTKSRFGVSFFDEPADFGDDFDGNWRRKNKPDGGMFGGYAGYNWQMPDSGIVLGIEGDFYGANAKDSKSATYYDYSFDPADVLTLRGKEKIKSTWAIRGRLGWTIENFMPYIAGGFAGASMKSSIASDQYEDDVLVESNSLSSTKTYSGWTVGAGAEWMVTPSWVLRVDYQYKDLGKKNNLSASSYTDAEFDVVNRTKLTTNQVTFGAAFKF